MYSTQIVIKPWNNLLPPDAGSIPIFNNFYLAKLSSCAPILRKYVPIATWTGTSRLSFWECSPP